MTKKQERNIIASVGTVLFMGFVILLLWLLRLSVTEQPKKDYIEVEYLEEEVEEPKEEPKPKYTSAPAGSGEKGSGKKIASPEKVETPEEAAKPIVADENTVELDNQRVGDSIKNFMSQFKFDSVPQSPGDSLPNPHPGPKPGPKKDGIGEWNLNGRDLVGSLPQPAKDFNQEGTVVVQITVDAAGNVIEAIVTGGNIGDKATQQLAIDAANKAKFTSAKKIKQVGTITYYFKFN